MRRTMPRIMLYKSWKIGEEFKFDFINIKGNNYTSLRGNLGFLFHIKLIHYFVNSYSRLHSF